VLDAHVVVLTNVALDHTEVLGETREEIAREKLAVVTPGSTVILGEPEWEPLAREQGAARVVHAGDPGRAAAEAFLGRELEGEVAVAVPGRFELHGDDVYAGAHNAAGVAWLVEQLPRTDYIVCAAILADKDARAMLAALAQVSRGFVATQTETERSLDAHELAELAREFFPAVESVADATAALDRARELAGPGGAVLVTGSLYLLRDLFGRLESVR
jgi:dihydrofolate synthase/folylpolyglutamate synthase